MLPDFLELFGVDLYGIAFERVLFLLLLVLGGWGLWGGVADLLDTEDDNIDRGSAWVRVAIGGGIVAWSGFKAIYAIFLPGSYTLLFQQELVIHTYALGIVTGFAISVWIAARAAEREGLRQTVILDLAFWALIGGLIGARLVFIVVNVEQYIDACTNPGAVGLAEADCTLALKFWEGGLVFYGAFLGAALVFVAFARKHNLDVLRLIDLCIPTLALGHAYGRFGCLGAGCCWGGVCTGDWGVVYPKGAPAFDAQLQAFSDNPELLRTLRETGHTLHAHPTQLYESFGEAAIFLFLILYRPWRRIHGELFALWLMLYGAFRTLSEITRGDRLRGYLFEIEVPFINTLFSVPQDHPTFLATSQFMGLLLLTAGAILWWHLGRKRRDLSTISL